LENVSWETILSKLFIGKCCSVRILVIAYGPLGDTLFTIPSLKSLRLGYPEAEIDLISSVAGSQFFQGNANIDRIISVDNESQLLRKIIKLREMHYDLGLALSHIGSYLLPFARADKKAGFISDELGFIYDFQLPDQRTIHAIEYCLRIVEAVGGEQVEISREYRLSISEDVIRQTMDKVETKTGLFLEGMSEKKLVIIHPGGKYYKLKRWPEERYKQLIKQLDRELTANFIIIGGPEERDMVVNLLDQEYVYNNLILDLVGELTIQETAALLSLADLFIGNDSAPQHISAAVKTPVVSLFGPTDPDNFHPYGVDHKIIRKRVECGPCFSWLGAVTQYLPQYLPGWAAGCDGQCMKQIEVDEVFDTVKAMLSTET
jgi:heptosyltransferase-2/heptosyltransferase-3